MEGADGDPDLTLARYRISDYQPGEEDKSNLALVGLMRTGLLKRFESSRRAFAVTLGRMIDQYEATLDILDAGRVPDSESIDEWIEADNDEAFAEALADGGAVETASASVHDERLREDLENDIEILSRWKRRAEAVGIEDDGKLAALQETLADIAEQAEADATNDDEFRRNRKVLLFSYYEDTVDWILDYLDEAVEEDDRLRALVRGRISLQEERTSFANKIHSLLLDNGITRRVKPLSVKGREFLAELSLPTPWDGLLSSYLSVIDTLTEEIGQLDERIEERAEERRETQLLMTIPGIAHYSALVIYAKLGEINRFERAKEVVRYVGLNPVIRESGDSRFVGSISKKGSGKVRWILVQAVHSAVHTVKDEYLSRFYHRIERRKNKQKAAVATARKLLVSIYHMLDRGEVYDPPGVAA